MVWGEESLMRDEKSCIIYLILVQPYENIVRVPDPGTEVREPILAPPPFQALRRVLFVGGLTSSPQRSSRAQSGSSRVIVSKL